MRCDAVVSCDVVVEQQGLCRRLPLGRSSPHQEEKEWLDAIGGCAWGRGKGYGDGTKNASQTDAFSSTPGRHTASWGGRGRVLFRATGTGRQGGRTPNLGRAGTKEDGEGYAQEWEQTGVTNKQTNKQTNGGTSGIVLLVLVARRQQVQA